ncbi:protein kinase, putative [Leishmania guyanensis]|uniref:non-specific serine/threonine protein kinase n=1 Tax=Leishmania guyanensis TaxID=5670 RepID=A0A1E1IPD0_LEIGU
MGMEHYTKVKDLGGTNGAFLARDRQQPDRLVVIKRLAEGTQGVEELNASLRLRHPHIVRFLESFFYDGSLFVVMSYESGGDLDGLFHYLTQHHKTPTTHTLLLWFVQLLEALVYCHDHSVIHRDIKPGNILVSTDTKVLYLGDFGSAKTLSISNVTSTFVGSPMWISPEVLLGTSYSYAADVWSMGCVFYEMATLRKPFSAPSFAHLVQQITWGHITPLPPHVAQEVRSIIHSMLVLDPAQRVTAREALEVARVALNRAEELRCASPSPVRSPARLSKPPVASSPPLPVSPPKVADYQPRQRPLPQSPQSYSSPSSPPSTGTTPPPASATSDPLLVVAAEAKAGEDPTPQGSHPTAIAAAPESLSHVAGVKQLPDVSSPALTAPESTTSFTSLPSMVEFPVPKQPPAVLAVAAEAAVGDKPERHQAVPAEAAQLCMPQQVALPISTEGFFRKEVQTKEAPKRKSVAASKASPLPQRQRVPSVPAQTALSTEAPRFVRQISTDSMAIRCTTSATAASRTRAAELPTPSRRTGGSTKVVVKAVPPTHVPKRALDAAENLTNPPCVPRESPTRGARGLNEAQQKSAPMPPPKPAAQASDAAPADQWFVLRMRDLRAMEKYLHHHRVDDDKALKTYDQRRDKEGQPCDSAPAVRAADKPLAAPHRRTFAKKPANAPQSPGVLILTPPRHRCLMEGIPAPPLLSAARQQQHGAAKVEARHGAAAVPFSRQVSYARQASHPACDSDLRQSSLPSAYNGRQASHARGRPRVSLEEQLKSAEGRVVARVKREEERQRMKELIKAQRAAAKKQNRKAKRDGAIDVQIVLPDHVRHTTNCVVSAD